MKLTDHRGTSVELSAIRYEFPQITREQYDANRLVIGGRLEKDGAAWKFQDPCLLTNEVLALAEWFDELRRNPHKNSEISFIEPNFYFKWSSGALRVDLE